MLATLWRKYDACTIVSFLCLGIIFGLNGCVQSSILINFYEPKIACEKAGISTYQTYFQEQSHNHYSSMNKNIPHEKGGDLEKQKIGLNFSSNQECNPCQEGFRGKYYFVKEYSQIYSMVEQFSWYCISELQKIMVMSMMASGLFFGFLTNFLIGDSSKISQDRNNPITQRSMRQIIFCLYAQTIALLCVPLVDSWYQAGIILAVWNFGYSFFYSSVYNFVGQKYGTLIVKYSSTIYHTIWSLVMVGFLIFIRFFGDWHQIMFYFSGLPQAFLVICLTIALYLQNKPPKARSVPSQLQTQKSGIQEQAGQISIKYLQTEDQNRPQYYFNSDVTEYNEDPEQSQKNQQQTFVLSRFQTEDFLLTVQQVNQTQYENDSHYGTSGGIYYGGATDLLSFHHQDSYNMNDNSRGTNDLDSFKKHARNAASTKNQIFENLKQKMYINTDITPEQLKQQQDQFIMHSDLNILDINNNNIVSPSPNTNTAMHTLENEMKSSKPNIHYQSQLIQNTYERLDSSDTQNTVKFSHGPKEITSFKLIQNKNQKDEDTNQNSPNLSPIVNTPNQNNSGQISSGTIQSGNRFDFKEEPEQQKYYSQIYFPSSNQINNQMSIQTLQQLQPSTVQTTNIQAIRNEMRMRWIQLKRDPSQKLNILIFLLCWITANMTNYSIYITLLFIEGDVYLKLTFCIIIEIISNYLASFILIHLQLRKVILSLFLISGIMCCTTYWMSKRSDVVLIPLFITKLCLELFFPIKTYFLQFVLHSQYFKISLGLGDTLSTLLQALMPLLIYFSYSDGGYFLTYIGVLMMFCVFMMLQIEMINIYGLNQQFSVIYREENKQSNIKKLAEIMEVDSAADISLYSFQPHNH